MNNNAGATFRKEPGIRSTKPSACARNEYYLIVKTKEGHHQFLCAATPAPPNA